MTQYMNLKVYLQMM